MSNRFSLPWGVQKPPAVCKKPPTPSTFPPRPFNEKEFQAFIQWHGPAYGSNIQFSGPATMSPAPLALQHTGWLHAPPYALRLRMTQTPTLPALTLEITLHLYSAPLYQKTATINPPKQLDPFDTGLVKFTTAIPTEHVQARVWS